MVYGNTCGFCHCCTGDIVGTGLKCPICDWGICDATELGTPCWCITYGCNAVTWPGGRYDGGTIKDDGAIGTPAPWSA